MRAGFTTICFVVISAVIALSFAVGVGTPVEYSGTDYRVQFNEEEGIKHGRYQSWYSNGKKKAEGRYQNNNRIGEWTVWDSVGSRKVVRAYTNNFVYRQVYPKVIREGPIRLWTQLAYVPERTPEGYFRFAPLAERAVAYSKRVWRYLPYDSSSSLFRGNALYHAIVDSALSGKYKIYIGNSVSTFGFVITPEQLLALGDTVGKKIVGYRIMEDNFFDKDRMLSETRIVGIAPVIGADGTDAFDLGWIVYSRLRTLLASFSVSKHERKGEIENLDDLFFFRSFRSVIERESNVHNRSLQEVVDRNPATNLRHEQLGVELSMIEAEHDFWLYFSK